jgi:predicted ArsR family transcriptional regulator
MTRSIVPLRAVPDEVQAQAKALGDPTRFRIFRHIFEAARPVSVAELTSYTQLNHNAVRQHLDVLSSAGLVASSIEDRTRPGRPRLLYEVTPETAGLWGTQSPYEQLAVALAEALRSGSSPEEVGRRVGLARVAAIAHRTPVTDAFGVVENEMARAGFRPVRRSRSRGLELVLQRCPFESAAAINAGAVCQLHRGLAGGIAQGTGKLELEDLVPKNPHKAGCRLLLVETS